MLLANMLAIILGAVVVTTSAILLPISMIADNGTVFESNDRVNRVPVSLEHGIAGNKDMSMICPVKLAALMVPSPFTMTRFDPATIFPPYSTVKDVQFTEDPSIDTFPVTPSISTRAALGLPLIDHVLPLG